MMISRHFAALTAWAILCGATDYEAEVRANASELAESGCHNVLQNPDTLLQQDIHEHLTSTYSWPILTAKAMDEVAAFVGDDGVVDFGAGGGYFSYLLRQRGVDVLALDDWSEGEPDRTWTLVQTGGVESLEGTESRVLLLSWPPKNTSMGIDALRQWGGDRLVYAGEILRRTGTVALHRELAENWRLVEIIQIPTWRNFSDAIYLFERAAGNGVGWAWMMRRMTEHCTFGPEYKP